MIIKAWMNDVPLARVRGLPHRRTAELVRMVEAFASERRAAGRPVPTDAALVLEGVPHAAV
jgi:L-ribulose-5-phosphate 3-epimerase